MSYSILVIDDDDGQRDFIERAFAAPEWRVSAASDPRPALEMFAAGAYDVVLLDLHLPGIGGLEVLELLAARDPLVPVIMLTAYGDVATAVEAMKLGAENFLSKPFDLAHLEALVRGAVEKAGLRRRTEYLLRRQAEGHPLSGLGSTPVMRRIADEIEILAPTDAALLLLGETGTGKGWTAELIHSQSRRRAGAFVDVNCAGLNPTFLESELFGHEKGAFTDARALKRGLLEVANGGTLFLDEIGDLAPELQPKLLKVIESQRFRRLGATREISVNVRIITASNHDLKELVRLGRFRSDLYYRIAAHTITLPPLRERGADALLQLALRLLTLSHRERGRGPLTISTDALQLLLQHDWPGNIRELRNVIEYAVLRAGDAAELLPSMLPADVTRTAAAPADPIDRAAGLHARLALAERALISAALNEARGNRSGAARALGISRASLYEKLKRHGLIA